MRRPPLALALTAAAALAAAGCSTSPCQELGERLCGCTGLSGDTCKTQVEDQVKALDPAESTCDALLSSCREPAGASFCEWLGTAGGKAACGLTPPQP